ncbi:hypothetical protein TEA_001621 [Camellia sinensis var. sinensis]|uniref:CASP-like protein n=1 Tax=Camellia sinensis var. sinensis TaxID=542762 RepID=A0A4S4D377_CAMSN|nr:hypothetical protein TEA_001621 [Camellia sinensis var. sinensis]
MKEIVVLEYGVHEYEQMLEVILGRKYESCFVVVSVVPVLSYLGVGVGPGNIPVYHESNLKVVDRRVRIAELVLSFLVVANGLVAAYSLVQGLRCVVSMVKGTVLFNKSLAWAIFSCDQLMAYLTLAAVAAAAQSSVFAKFGESELQWMKICNMYGKFCNQVGEGLASAVIASLSMAVLLYDGDKGVEIHQTFGVGSSQDSTHQVDHLDSLHPLFLEHQ